MNSRIPTDVWVMAQVRRCHQNNTPAYVVQKGALASGTVVVKVVMGMEGCRLFNQTRDMEGNIAWMHVFDEETVEEKRADDYIQRSIQRDPDIWVIEVEDKTGNNPFEGKIL